MHVNFHLLTFDHGPFYMHTHVHIYAGLDHSGSSFYVTFLPFPDANLYEEVKMFITTPEHVPVTFTVSAPENGYFQTATVEPGSVDEFTFNREAFTLRNTTDRSKGIIITADRGRQIIVYAVQDIANAPDSFLILPPHDLEICQYTYIAAMIHTLDGGYSVLGYIDYHALIGIVSAEDDTLLTITPTHNVTIGTEPAKAGESVVVTLHKAETLLIAFIGDLTGTKVISNKPISFFSGDQCPYIPSGVPACDQIVEQLPPVEAWGRQFATVPLKTRQSFDVFRIVVAENSTMVNISCMLHNGTKGYTDTFSLNEVFFVDVNIHSTNYCWMEADKSILLLQFAVGQLADNVPSDPFMTLVPAVSHFISSFTLPVVNSSLNSFTHYLNIIIPAEHYQPDKIFLDSQSLQSLALECVAITHNGQTMAYGCQLEVNATTHTLIHGNSRGVFGVISYGFASVASYGHIGGMRFPQLSEFIVILILCYTVDYIESYNYINQSINQSIFECIMPYSTRAQTGPK